MCKKSGESGLPENQENQALPDLQSGRLNQANQTLTICAKSLVIQGIPA